MANTSVINGLQYKYCLHGREPIMETCYIDAADGTATFVGDAVKTAAEGSSADGFNISVIQCAAADPIFGVVQAVDQVKGMGNNMNLTRLHRPASTGMYVHVITDPMAVYEIQEDAVGGALAAADVGLNASIVVGSGSTVTGLSGMQLDTSTAATTAALELKILGFVNRPDNAIGANAKVLVMINNHKLKGGTGTAGI